MPKTNRITQGRMVVRGPDPGHQRWVLYELRKSELVRQKSLTPKQYGREIRRIIQELGV